MSMKTTAFLVSLFAVVQLAIGVEPCRLQSGSFVVTLDPSFPGVVSYALGGSAVLLPRNTVPEVLLNGTGYRPEVVFHRNAEQSAEYRLNFTEIGVTLVAKVDVSENVLTITLADIREAGAFAVRTIEIPGLALLSGAASDGAAFGNFPGSYYASEKPEDQDHIGKVAALEFTPSVESNDKKASRRGKGNIDAKGRPGASYAFVSNGRIVAGLWSNVLEENFRMIVQVNGLKEGRTLSVAPGKWTWREIPSETLPAPQVKLIVAADENGDGKVDWQDGAIAYRKNAPMPYGGEKTKKYPISHIAMDFASQACNPFLRVLDNAKKVWLYTDGLGQRIQYKGFAGEGHDSSHPDYAGNVGRRQGGHDELCYAMRRGHDFNILSGIHINAHEYHKEAKWFSPAIADVKKVGWSWLDDSYLTDYRYDSAYGTLYQRLDAMRTDLPWLDFVYLDVYFGHGWPGWRMHSKVNSLGIMQHTEFPGVMERAVIWNHVANDWTQGIWGKGDRSVIARFIYYSMKNTFQHDPLLRGSNCDGFMGWHAETDMMKTIKSAFTVNLPTAYLQHFSLIQQTPLTARFSGGVHTEVVGDTAKMYGPDGQLVDSCRYEKLATRTNGPVSDVKFACRPTANLCFIPWDPIAQTKIYHWNDKGGESTWTLPGSWKGGKAVKLYRLTDVGRVFERDIPVARWGNRVTLTGILPETPYVIYRETPCVLPDMCWSEGGLVHDTGFDSHTFDFWRKADDAGHVTIENDKTGQTELVMRTAAAGEVRQEVAGLIPAQIYAASVWVSIGGKRPASLAVEPASPGAPAFVDPNGPKTPVVLPVDAVPFTGVSNVISSTTFTNYTDSCSKYMRNWHRMKVTFTAPAAGKVDLVIRAATGSDAVVKFDDVRLVKAGMSLPPANARKVVLFEDFENVDEGWGPFVYGFQGPMQTHLSETHVPYTDDTTGGEFSLKSSREEPGKMLYRTVPATLKLKPNTAYQVRFDYLCNTNSTFAFVAGPDVALKPSFSQVITDRSWKPQSFRATFKTDSAPDWYIGMKNIADDKKRGIFVLDNLLVEEVD